jgi:MFS family permease
VVTYGDAIHVREFRALWLSRAISLMGDQLARVALSVLVFNRTHSAGLTGLVYALTYLPYLVGPLVAGIADARPRREVMVVIDVARALALAVMALPGMPLVAMCALLVCVTAVSPVYDAARAATVPELLPPNVYPTGLALLTATTEGAQVLGFAVGGGLVATFGAKTSLWLDALTFAAAAVLIIRGLTKRPAAMAAVGREPWNTQIFSAARLIFGSPRLRGLLSLAWLNSLWLVPEGLAAPYAASLHAGPVAVGMLLAAIPAGCVVGAVIVGRFVTADLRERLMTPLALLAAAPLLACALRPGLAFSVLLWMLCGVGTSYNIPANAAFVQGLPNHRRAQAFALVTAGMVTGQGLGALLGGVLAGATSPSRAVGVAGLVGCAMVALLAATWLRRDRMIVLPDLLAAPADVPVQRQAQRDATCHLAETGAESAPSIV